MTVFDKLNKVQISVMALSTAVLAAGCHCGSSSHGAGYYSYTPAPYSSSSASAGAAETKTEVQTGTNMVIPLYQESLAVGTRQVEQGTVRLRKVVKTETVNQPIQLRKETVVIEREPASGESSADMSKAFQEGQETVIQLWREEPVVETKIVPAGQVVARRQFETEQTSVQRQVRKEDIDVDKSGEAQNVTISGDMSSAQGGGADTGSQAYGKSAGGPITDVSTITGASDPASLVQRSVNLSNVKCQRVISDRVVEIQDDSGRAAFVRLEATNPDVKAGDKLNLSGTVKEIPAGMMDLGLGDEVKQALKNKQVYIDAMKYEVTNR
jgi:uncharacterized protein (TIGR02271 family)